MVDQAKARQTHNNTFQFLRNVDDDTARSTGTKDDFSFTDPNDKKDEFSISNPEITDLSPVFGTLKDTAEMKEIEDHYHATHATSMPIHEIN